MFYIVEGWTHSIVGEVETGFRGESFYIVQDCHIIGR